MPKAADPLETRCDGYSQEAISLMLRRKSIALQTISIRFIVSNAKRFSGSAQTPLMESFHRKRLDWEEVDAEEGYASISGLRRLGSDLGAGKVQKEGRA